MRSYLAAALIAAALTLAGCVAPPQVTQGDIDALSREIGQLGPNVDPEEAARAARIAYTYSAQLARDYNVTDPPIVHNAKVNSGLRERGLCHDWAEDVLARLGQENFRTLDLHWGISPPLPARIIHHTALISARGDPLEQAIVLDPWRKSGALHWAHVADDTRYDWRPGAEVTAELVAAGQSR